MRRGRIIACVVLAGIFLAALVTSLGYSLIDALGPGPGFFPVLAEPDRDHADGRDTHRECAQPRNHRRDYSAGPAAALQGGGVLVALAAAAALFEPLGFRLTMLLFIAGILWMLGARSPFGIAFTAVAGSFGVFHVFLYWLKVPLPTGAFGI